jgi:tetratricopeptide (TPR) repeat protein
LPGQAQFDLLDLAHSELTPCGWVEIALLLLLANHKNAVFMLNQRSIFLACLCLVLIGCTTQGYRAETPLFSGELAELQPEQEPNLTSNLVYHVLASEIALKRRKYPDAYTHALQAAELSSNPEQAERAAQIALHANLNAKALKATALWIELDNKSLKAHQLSALLYSRMKRYPEVANHLREVIRIANESNENGYLQAAAIAEKTGNPRTALELMQSIIPDKTDQPDALYALALSAAKAKQDPDAEHYIRQALKRDPDNTKYLLLLSHILIQQKQHDEGLSLLEQALKKSPADTELRLAYARKLVESQRLEAALTQFERLNKKNPDNPDVLYAIGVIQAELGKSELGSNTFHRLLDLGKKTDEAHYHLGLIEEQRGHNQAALIHYKQVSGKNVINARLRMAKILSQTDMLDQARELLAQLRASYPSQDIRLHLYEADLLRDKRQYILAHEVYNHALENHRGNHELLYARALNAVDFDRIDILEEDLNRILLDAPDHVDALNALGYTLADRTDRYDEARRYIQRALALKPNNPAILDSMGWVEFRLGNLNTALEYLQQAAAINPDPEIAAHLGEVLWILNRKQQAMDVWRKANEADADNPYIRPVMQRLGATP